MATMGRFTANSMPEATRRHVEDNFYRKGQFSVKFLLDPQSDSEDEHARHRALQLLMYAIRDEVGLKPSSFVDVVEEEDEAGEVYTVAEFLIYNKLGVTSLGKLKRFMDDHLIGDAVGARILLIDPKTDTKFEATDFTIQYLFHEFVAHAVKSSWEDLKILLKTEDRGYSTLTGQRAAAYRRQTMPTEYSAAGEYDDDTLELIAFRANEALQLYWDQGEDLTDLIAALSDIRELADPRG